MIIKLASSKLFTTDPAIRFAVEHGVSQDVWREIWKRYKIMDYTIEDLCDFFYVKVGKRIKRRLVRRWIFRGEIYALTRPIMKRGVESVTSEFFGDFEGQVTDEILKHMKSGGTRDSRIMA